MSAFERTLKQHLVSHCHQLCIDKNGGGYTQRSVAKGLKVPCLFMITEVSIRCPKKPGGCRDVARPGGAEAPPNVILAPHPNEFQPMKYPGLAKSAQMYGLTAGNKPTYG